ncbi:MAG: efflux RND transporter permease subunit [Candidatus Sumerlaeia bacterium]|nr:efflux RND transporter permease subunit [Candidatus Sumerlaeia bacterium]
MKIAAFTVRRPVLTTMCTLIVVVFGAVSLTRLPIDLLPEITYPTLSVSTNYGNASPEEMETLVTRVIEEAVSAVPGVEEITSESAEGVSNVRVRFSWKTDLNVASNDIRDRIDRVLNNLPPDVSRPQLRKFDVAAFPIVMLGIFSELDPIELRDVIDKQVQYRIEQTPGVASSEVWGGLEREMQVNLDIEKIKALAIPLDQILRAIREANLNLPAGVIERGNLDVTIRTPGEFESVEELAGTVVAIREGVPVTLGQIARIEDTHQRITRIVRINGVPGARLAVRKQSGTNTVEVADRVLREAARINADLPQLEIVPVIDTSLYIRRSIANVQRSVLLGGVLAIVVLFVFLRSLRSTFVISTAIPISIIASFALLYFCGFTVNLMTLGGLALGVGMMVDNAIVVLENIYRLREEGMETEHAAIEGTHEVTPAIVASTITTLVIFLPLLFVEGMTGILFKQLAYVVAFSLICSLMVAITLVPVLAAKFLRRQDGGHATAQAPLIMRVSERLFIGIETLYRDVLELALRFRILTALFVIALFCGSLFLMPHIGSEFLPPSDEGEIRVDVEMAVGTRLAIINETMKHVEAIVDREVPEATHTVVNLGSSSFRPSGGTRGSIQVAVGPTSSRTRSSEKIAEDVRRAIGPVPGATVRARASEGLRILRLGSGGEDRLQIEIYGYEFAVLDELAHRVQQAVSDIPGITEVRVSREAGVPQEIVRIDRDRAADLGLSVARVAQVLETSVGGTRAGNFRRQGYEYRIQVRIADAEKLTLDDLLDLPVANDRGEPVILRNVVQLEPRRGPQIVERKNQERLATVSANYTDRKLDALVADVQEVLRQIPRPNQYQILIAGDVADQKSAFQSLLISLVMALVLVYMVLASLYESLTDPFIVMFSVPLAAIGVLVMLFLSDTTFNTQTFIGCIMLGGIVVNNAILLVDQASSLRTGGYAVRAAVLEAGRRRLRPILMTSLTTMLGLVPLALGMGEGSEQQAPLARAVIGGMLSSTVITLVFIPLVYSIVHHQRRGAPAAQQESGRAQGLEAAP